MPKPKGVHWVLKRKALYIGGYSLTALFRDSLTGKLEEKMGWGASFAFKQSEAHPFYDLKLLRKLVKAVNLDYPSIYGKLTIWRVG